MKRSEMISKIEDYLDWAEFEEIGHSKMAEHILEVIEDGCEECNIIPPLGSVKEESKKEESKKEEPKKEKTQDEEFKPLNGDKNISDKKDKL